MIPQLPECNNVLIVAPVSSGKSFLLEKWIGSVARSVYMDITAESLDGDYRHVWHSPKHLAEILTENPYMYRIAYHPSTRNFLLDFQWITDLLWTNSANGASLNRWLVVDEIHELDMTEPMDRVIRYARHVQLGFIGATQKFSDVSTLMRDNTRMYVLFHNDDDNELKAIRGKFGKIGEQRVRNLRPLIYDEVTKVTHQTPEVLIWRRGYGMAVYDLGDSSVAQSTAVQTEPIKKETQEQCLEKSSKDQQPPEPAPSLVVPSGQLENP